eukprot:jgi/Galph1/4823/GphlegSOOS_G3440.1
MGAVCVNSSERLLWQILKHLLEQDNTCDFKVLRKSLSSLTGTQMQEKSLGYHAYEDRNRSEIPESLRDNNNNSSITASSLEEAIQHSIRCNNWSLALVLSRLLGSSHVEDVLRLYIRNHKIDCPKLRFLLLLAMDSSLKPEDFQSMDWREAMCTLLECEQTYRVRGLVDLGDYLSQNSTDVYAAHCCYVVAGQPLDYGKTIDTTNRSNSRIVLVGYDHRLLPHAAFSSLPCIVRSVFYSFHLEKDIPLAMHPYLLYEAYVLLESGRLNLSKYLCDYLVQKAHALLKSDVNDAKLARSQKLTAVYYSYLEHLEEKLKHMLSGLSGEEGENGVSLTRSLSKVFRSIAKSSSKKNLRPRSSSNSSWESFAAAAVSIIAPAEGDDAGHTDKAQHIPSLSASETSTPERVIPATVPTYETKELTVSHRPVIRFPNHGGGALKQTSSADKEKPPQLEDAHSALESNVSSVHTNIEDDAARESSATNNDNNVNLPTNNEEGNFPLSRQDANAVHSSDKCTTATNDSKSARRSLGSFLMDKLSKIAGPKQANLGQENKFYYDEKLGRWVCENAEENDIDIPPPPLAINPADSSNKTEQVAVKRPETIKEDISRTMSQRRWSARARYVDTFGQTDTQVTGTKPPLLVPPSSTTLGSFTRPVPNDASVESRKQKMFIPNVPDVSDQTVSVNSWRPPKYPDTDTFSMDAANMDNNENL